MPSSLFIVVLIAGPPGRRWALVARCWTAMPSPSRRWARLSRVRSRQALGRSALLSSSDRRDIGFQRSVQSSHHRAQLSPFRAWFLQPSLTPSASPPARAQGRSNRAPPSTMHTWPVRLTLVYCSSCCRFEETTVTCFSHTSPSHYCSLTLFRHFYVLALLQACSWVASRRWHACRSAPTTPAPASASSRSACGQRTVTSASC